MPTSALDTTAEAASPAAGPWVEVRRLEAHLAAESHLMTVGEVKALVGELQAARGRLAAEVASLSAP